MERKCPQCGTWNEDQDYCKKCNALLNPDLIDKQRRKEQEQKRQLRPPNAIDVWLEKISKSKNPIVIVLYYIFYSIWFLFMGLVTIILYLVAGTPG